MSDECEECYNPDFCERHGFCICDLDFNEKRQDNE